MKTKFLVCSAIVATCVIGCGQTGDQSNMDKSSGADSMNTMTTYPSSTDSGTYGSAADSVNYNNRNISADDSAGIKKPGN